MRRHSKKALICIIVFGLLLRVGMLCLNMQRHPALFEQRPETLQCEAPCVSDFGFEIGNIAYAIVCEGQGFASPFGGSTGPTAWIAPGPVMVYCLAFELFGCFSRGALLFLFGFSLVLSAAIIVMVYRVSLTMFGNSAAALVAALVFACSLQDVEMYFQGYQQDFNLNVFWFISVFYLFVRYTATRTVRVLVKFSLCTGIALLFIPVLACAVVLMAGMFIVFEKGARIRALGDMLVASLLIACIIGPCIFYQKDRLGVTFFIKSNSAFELYNGNTPVSGGYLDNALFEEQHPARNKQEFLLYSQLGEIAYIESKRELFKKEFDLERFVRTTVTRGMYFFFVFKYHVELQGISFWMALRFIGYAVPGITLVVFALAGRKYFNRRCGFLYLYVLGYAFPYLFVAVMYRYSFPIVTLTSVLLGVLVHAALVRMRAHAV